MDMVLTLIAVVGLALVVVMPFWYATRKKPTHRDRDHNLSAPHVSNGADVDVNAQTFIHH